MELLDMFKRSIGVLDNNTLLDDYYLEFVNMAKSDLGTDDISQDILDSDLGKYAIVYYAKCLLEKQDIASNSTIILLRNKLADMTKGKRYSIND